MRAKLPIIFLIVVLLFGMPIFVGAQFQEGTGDVVGCSGADCGFDDFINLIESFIDVLITIATPIAVIMFAYAGFLYMTAAGDMNKVQQAHTIFKNVFIGFAVILGAWVLINAVVSVLLNEDFSLLDRI